MSTPSQFSRCKVSASEFKSANELFNAIKDALKNGSPVDVAFTTKQDIESLVKTINDTANVQPEVSADYVGSTYPCQSDVVSAFPMEKFCSEIKVLGNNMFPLSVTIDSVATFNKFALDYAQSSPATKLTNFVEPGKERRFFNITPSKAPDWLPRAINIFAIVAAVALFICILPLDDIGARFKSKKASSTNVVLSDKERIIGEWKGESSFGPLEYTFNAEGVCSVYDGYDVDFGTYEIKNGRITMKFIRDGGVVIPATLEGSIINLGDGIYLTKK